MPQSKILLDTNAYLRLAYNIHPLLFVSFGGKKYTLYVIDGFQKEFERNRRLKNKFYWVNDPEYRENRLKKIKLSRNDTKMIDTSYSYIWQHNIAMSFGASRPDVRALAFGYVLNIPVVTDDRGMIELAESIGIEVWRILKLMKIMNDNDHVDIKNLSALVEYLDYIDDLPYPSFIKDFKKQFKI
ncbi:MAG: DNA-binding protein [Deltaproteobacteria bacterium]|nr:DNA-binding protein [Deltaproteobacteria bacterium]